MMCVFLVLFCVCVDFFHKGGHLTDFVARHSGHPATCLSAIPSINCTDFASCSSVCDDWHFCEWRHAQNVTSLHYVILLLISFSVRDLHITSFSAQIVRGPISSFVSSTSMRSCRFQNHEFFCRRLNGSKNLSIVFLLHFCCVCIYMEPSTSLQSCRVDAPYLICYYCLCFSLFI